MPHATYALIQTNATSLQNVSSRLSTHPPVTHAAAVLLLLLFWCCLQRWWAVLLQGRFSQGWFQQGECHVLAIVDGVGHQAHAVPTTPV